MTTLVLNFDDDIFKKLNDYASKNKINLIDYAKNLLIDEMIEAVNLSTETINKIADFETREKNGTLKTISHEEAKRVLGL